MFEKCKGSLYLPCYFIWPSIVLFRILFILSTFKISCNKDLSSLKNVYVYNTCLTWLLEIRLSILLLVFIKSAVATEIITVFVSPKKIELIAPIHVNYWSVILIIFTLAGVLFHYFSDNERVALRESHFNIETKIPGNQELSGLRLVEHILIYRQTESKSR